jgi:hypothetical protein
MCEETDVFCRARLVLLALVIGLTACSKAVIVKEDASEVADATKKAVVASRAFYAKLDSARQSYLIREVAADGNCSLGFPMTLIEDATKPLGWRCLTNDEKELALQCNAEPPTGACTPSVRQRLVDRSQTFQFDERQTALTLVDAMADYQILLAKIVLDPEYDAKGELTELGARVNAFNGLLAMVKGKKSDDQDFGPQVDAVSALLDLVSKTAEDQRDLARLKVALDGPGSPGRRFEDALQALINRYEGLDRHLLDSYQGEWFSSRLKSYNDARQRLSESERIEQITPLVAAYIELQQQRSAPDALSQSLHGLAEMQIRLRMMVVENQFDEEARRRLAAESMRQFKTWFEAIRGVVSLFL